MPPNWRPGGEFRQDEALFDESLSPRLVDLLRDLFPSPKVRFETDSLAQVISRFLNIRSAMLCGVARSPWALINALSLADTHVLLFLVSVVFVVERMSFRQHALM